MTPERWRRVKLILESAMELDAGARRDFLDSVCADAALRREIDSLLLAHDQAGSDFLNLGAWLETNSDEEFRFRLQPGKRVGVYEILEEIAQGGMGAVYRAVRADGQYTQQVALKIVRSELGGEWTAARFRNERQILATLDHPNIARILDGGNTEEGLPYFVMELIEGLPGTDYCDHHKLTIDERLRLFRTICSAVEYAHQRLVIHRDIKPTNILVTREGVPKLLDFGIAKILDPTLVPEAATVTAGIWLMTPEYASPEQLRGDPITTASDVYSLGLVLYELLTGRHAYRFAGRMPHEIARTVLETEPDKPSTAARPKRAASDDAQDGTAAIEVVSSRRAVSPEQLRRRLAGDLDNIVIKAIAKNPETRYRSADQLSEEIERYLKGLPVMARRSTLRYRGHKFIARHKTGVTAAALVFLSLLGGAVLTVREARIARANEIRAERRFNDVRKLANSLMFEVHDSIKDLAGATPARKLLVTKALEYLDGLSLEAAGDVSLKRELASAYEKVGNVQGNPYEANLGDTAGALASYHKALAIRESLNTGKSPETQRDLANDYEWISMALDTSGDYLAALEYARKDFAIQGILAKAAPGARSQERLAGAYFLIAHCFAGLEDPQSALENYRKSAAIRETIANTSAFTQSRLAGTYGYMAPLLWLLGDRQQSMTLLHKALEIAKTLSDTDPTNATKREYLDEAYYWIGYYLELSGDFAQALENYRHALSDFQVLASADPNEVRTEEYVARCHKSIGTSLVAEGSIAQGLQAIRQAISIFEKLPAEQRLEDLADAYGALGLAYSGLAQRAGVSRTAKLANLEQSCAAYQKSLDNWLEVKSRHALTVFTAYEPGRITSELARCSAEQESARGSE